MTVQDGALEEPRALAGFRLQRLRHLEAAVGRAIHTALEDSQIELGPEEPCGRCSAGISDCCCHQRGGADE